MFTKKSAPGVREQRRGFTMVELIAVLAMLAVLAAAAIPSIAGFIEHGKQINRNNIARTLYLAVQSELVKMKSEGRLINELATPYFTPDPDGNGYTLNTATAAMGRNSVWTKLGIEPPAEEKAKHEIEPDVEVSNAELTHYISKPRGFFSTTGATELDAFCRLLDTVVLDKSILNNAILMEYNVETGVVLSIFYGDTEAFADGGEFDYLTDPDSIYNISGNRGYEFAEHRKQGYYGANGTGDLLPPPDMMPQTKIFDGAFKQTPDRQVNVLYVEAYLQKPEAGETIDLSRYTLSLIPDTGDEIELGSLQELFEAGRIPEDPSTLGTPQAYQPDEDVFQYGMNVTNFFERYIIILDHVNGTTADDLSIEDLGITTSQIVQAKVAEGTWGEPSTTFANTLFFGDMNGGFEVRSARHLYNIRHNLGGYYYQTRDINMQPGDPNNIPNFTPIGTVSAPFNGTYDAYDAIKPYAISNLAMDYDGATGQDNIGLFGRVELRLDPSDSERVVGGVVQYLDLIGVNISGRQNVGAVAGQSSGAITNVTVSGAVTGSQDNAGGLVGLNSGRIALSSSAVAVTGVNDVGGLVGDNSGTLVTPTITGITVTGTGENVGGVAGVSRAAIQNAVVKGITVIGTGNDVLNVGGVVGRAEGDDAVVQNVTVESNGATPTRVEARENVGGVVGLAKNAVSDAEVTGATVTGYGNNVGGIVGKADDTKATISDVTVTGLTIRGTRSNGGGDNVGGIVGWTNNTVTEAEVVGGTSIYGKGEDVGGIVGRADTATATIDDVLVDKTKIESERVFIGGVVGETRATVTNAEVKDSTITGYGDVKKDDQTLNSEYVGGIVGYTIADIGSAAGTIKVTDVEIESTTGNVGGVLGAGGVYNDVYGRPGAESINITGVTLEGVKITVIGKNYLGEAVADDYVGGVVGRLSQRLGYPDQTITQATATITNVTATNVTVTGGSQVGGVAGEFAPTTGGSIGGAAPNGITVTNATVTGTGNQIGGVAGNTTRSITNATVSGGSVTGTGQSIGGVAGETSASASIKNATVNGGTTVQNLVGDDNPYGNAVGGIVGTNGGTITDVAVTDSTVKGRYMVGGVAGLSSNAITDADVTNTGVSSRRSNAGGIAGEVNHTDGIIQNATVMGGTTGKEVTGGGLYIGGAVGKTSADMTNVTVSGISVTSGGASVGGILGGTNTNANATISNVIAIGTKVTGPSSNVGGIVGVLDTSTLKNAVYVSAADTAQITGDAVNESDSIGGIVGHNLGDISDVLFLALAPKGTDGNITPITANDAGVSNAYYLRGKPIRPEEEEIDLTTRDDYNMEKEINGPGTGYSTWVLTSRFNAATDGYRLGNPVTDWAKNDGFTAADHVDSSKTASFINKYPYPYTATPGADVLPTNWPIAANDVIEGPAMQYFERTGTGANQTFYVWNGKYRPEDDGLPKDGEILTQAGYAFITEEMLTDPKLFIRPARSADTVAWIEAGKFEFTGGNLDAAMGNVDYRAYILPLKELAAAVGDSDTPLELMYKNNEGAEVRLRNYIHPLFAKAVFDRNVTSFDPLHPPTFYVRTPWQMQNIGKLTTTTVDGPTKGKTFIQDRSFAVTVSNENSSSSLQWMGVAADRGVDEKGNTNDIAEHTLVEGGNIGDEFMGHFIGTGFEITDLTFGRGLFASIGQGIGRVTGVTVKKHRSDATGGGIGTIAVENEGIIENCLVEGSVFAGNNIEQVGAIAGQNTNIIRDCVVKDCEIKAGYNLVGGVVGNCSGTLERLAVINTTVKASGSYIGGVVGQKSGKTIQDVFFLSTVTPKEIADGSKAPPVDAVNGGGIVGQVYNSGTVTRALYLAVAPMSGSTIYPIDRSGSAAVTDSFYLYGLKYRVMPGGDWTEELYNDGTVSGGGEPMNTLELDLASLVYLDEVDMPGWDDGAKGYPYPILSKMESPTSWPEADGSDRPAQASRSDWGEQYTDAWPELAFVNGDFGEPYLPGKLNNVGLSQPDSGRTGVETVPNYGVNFGHDIYTYMTSVPGWSTRPSTSDTGIYANDQYIIEPMMPYPYVDSGNAYWGLMQTDYKGNGTSSGGDLRNSPNDATYVELNAEVPGTLYQIADTIPGQEFYWSFHHASRLAMSWDATAGNDAMNFYLSPVGTTRRDPLGNSIADDLWLIRPVESPRNVVRPNNSAVNYPADAASSNPNNTSLTGYNYAAWNTVKYLPDTTKGMEKYWAKHFQGFPASGVYLYDVWIGDKAEGGNGYGLTFWSTTNYNNLDINGYADIGGLETALGAGSADAKKIIGYWDIDNGWKQYYGRYIVPEGQTRTEFAYQSVRGTNDAYGNFLDGAVFKAEATLSVSETMYRTATQNGAVTPREVAGVVDAGDTITVEMTVKALGGAGTAQARNIQLRNQLKPFDQYVEFAGNVTVGGNSASSGYDYTDGVFTMPLEIAPGGEITVSFDIKVLSHIAGKTPPYSTLFYFIENQAEVHYTSYHEGQQISAAGYRRSSNASEQNQRVSISEIPMSKTVALVGNLDADGNLAPVDPVTTSETAPQVGETGSVFEVELNFSGKVAAAGFVSDTLPKDFSLVEGSIQKLAANGTWEPVEEDDRILYGTDGTDLRLVFLDVDFAAAAEQTYSFRYRMTYTGDGFGITYAGVDAYYRFRYDLNSIQLPVIEPKLGIRATAPDDAFTIPPTGGSIDLRQKANIKTILPYDGTALLPVIVFTDADGNPVDLDQTKFMAVLSGDGQLTLSPLVNGGTIAEGTYTLYYKTEAKETEAGGFDLSSRVAEITIEVSSSAPDPQAALPAPDAPNPAPDAVLPPVAAATLGLLGAALGGGLGLKNGVSTAVAALLGAVSLLLVLTGLVLLPEKKRRPRREKRG